MNFAQPKDRESWGWRGRDGEVARLAPTGRDENGVKREKIRESSREEAGRVNHGRS